MRILVVSGYGYWGNFAPTDLGGEDVQVGGGETAMVSIAKELAGLGHEVIVFYDTVPGRYHGVDYLPGNLFVPLACQLEHDVLVAWDAPYAFRYADRARMRVLAFQLNDATIGALDWTIDRYFHPSRWHADMFHGMYPEMDPEKSVAKITNGVDYSRYTVPAERNPNRVIYSSSPDRGLHHLLRFWPQVIDRVPEAELHIFYDMNRWLDSDEQLFATGLATITHERAVAIREFVSDDLPNVTFHGGVGQGRLAREQMSSAILAYPCDPVRETEGFSMTVLEGIVAGCNVVISNADAFPELWSDAPGVTMLPLPIDDETWVNTIVEKLQNGVEDVRHTELTLSWKHIARRWIREFESCLEAK